MGLSDSQRLSGIAISGYDEQFHRQNILGAGFQEYLVKPVDIRTLCTTIERLLATRPDPR